MSFANAFASSFPAELRRRGAESLEDGLVTLTAWADDRVESVVNDTEDDYEVVLTRNGKRFQAVCTCQLSSELGEMCKHIWGTILAADRATDDTPARSDRSADPAPPSSSLPALSPWRELLEPLSHADSPPVPGSDEIQYVIDVPASLKRQGLILDVLTFRRKKDGTRGALRPLRITRGQAAQRRDPLDRAILAQLAGAMQGDPWSSWYYIQHQELPRQPWVPDEMAQDIARRLCATGRCHLRLKAQKIEEAPLTWHDGPLWELWLAVREEKGGACEVTAELRNGDERLDPRDLIVLDHAGLMITGNKLVPLDSGGAAAWLPLLRRGEPLRVPAAEREDLLALLLAAPVLPRLELPPAMSYEETTVTPQPRLRLLPPNSRHTFNDWPLAKVSYQYEGFEMRAGVGVRGVYQKETRRFLLRDLDAESKALDRLAALGFRAADPEPSGEPTLRIAPTRLPAAVRTLIAEGWTVEAQGKIYRSAGRAQLRIASGIDWFELHGEVEFEGQTVGLPQLLAALRSGEGFVPLGDGSVGLLPEEWLKRWAPLAGFGQTEGDHLRFEVPQAVLLDAWLADEPEATWDDTFAQARERLHRFSGIAPAEAPAGFRGELRAYQQLGLGWLHFLRDFGLGGCLADDMGLGKTVQVLALLEARREIRATEGLPPALVVVPRSLVFNWLAEAAQFTPALRILDYTGSGRTQRAKENTLKTEPFAGHDVVLTTYGTLRRDIAALKEKEFDYVILDEAQSIKNAGSQTAKAARLLRGRHRLALTGTPVENHLGELWSLLEFLNPGFMGSSAFHSRSADLRDPDAASRDALARALRPLILRRTKQQVATELPDRVEQTLFCDLLPRQRRLYDELRDYYRSVLDKRIGTQGMGRSKLLVLEALLRLRQAACHPALVARGHADDPCAKLDVLLPQLTEVLDEGHKALVFSQFTSFLALLRRKLDAASIPYLYLDGKTQNRQELVEEFQSEGGRPLFLISLKAGGLGLNLTAADYVYLLDPWWNPAVEAQAVDRAHRIGQTRTVFAYRLVARDTVEEKILELQEGKRALADAIVQADQSLLANLSQEDLALLLS